MTNINNVGKYWGGLNIGPYEDDNIYPLLPLLKQEFPDWSSKQIKSYVELLTSKDDVVTDLLVARNEANYYVGILIYTIQQISCKQINKSKIINVKNNKKKPIKVLVIENLIASSPILQEQVFMTLVDAVVEIAKNNSYDFVELPKFDKKSYDLIKDKYQDQISESQGFRTYLKLSKSLTVNMKQ
jgi:hypothetical protein|tara:strand:- start:274 stop:828 length:555 start_codon:yes stop_codon:yes gene_type:complete